MSSRHSTLPVLSVLLATLLCAAPAHALYKVVGPDGKVTYTDRPAVDSQNKIQPVAEGGGSGSAATLPYDLRQVVQKYPVTLYTSENCTPCDAGRQLLQERGIPYSERQVSGSRDDRESLNRLTGGMALPTLGVGGQMLRGFQRNDWSSYLDVAGYPKSSRLPPNYVHAKPQPLTERAGAPAARPAPQDAAEPSNEIPEAPAPSENPSGIRF